MPRPLPIALIATLCLASNAYAIDKTPAAMKRIVEKAVAEVKKNRQDFEQANQAPLTDAKEELQDLAKKFIEEGKTEEAQTVLRQVKSLDADVLRMAKAPDPVSAPEPRPGPQKPLLERMAGKWDINNEPRHYLFYANGTAECAFDDDARIQSRGRITVLGPDVAEVVWDSQWRDTMRISGDGLALAVFSHDPSGKRSGDGFAVERIK